MGDVRVNIAYFFRNPEGFPWDALGLDRPYAAPLHSYLCKAAALFCDLKEKDILKQHPTLSELRRFATQSGGIFANIVKICDSYNDTACRFAKAKILVNWLDYQPEFKIYMQKRLDTLHRQGLISIPEGARPGNIWQKD